MGGIAKKGQMLMTQFFVNLKPDDGKTNLRGQTVYVHSVSTNHRDPENKDVRCRGFAFKFPGQETVMVPVTGITADHSPKDTKYQELKYVALREVLRRAKQMKLVNFTVKMQIKVNLIDEKCERYQKLKKECDKLIKELRVRTNFVKIRFKRKMSAEERDVDEKAGFASRIQYNTYQFPENWRDEELMQQVREQPFLVGFEETPKFLKETLDWGITNDVLSRYWYQ
ncbi:Oidioi.mRNA.OKI2018_I69.chr1.g1700.t1.cds [Oikopleura dioica]|uniref:Oidioi.mRNA.OKI2018_I69.chr1.g1700.t1.cds n=1 Tax=Oikopleura dioica TaxID=34765 RepID=A0ABN7SNQ5_OIKDI|nr:Oidioi.mRNA.OKI2018_I69.chr1.g1700.t1.cds [Oikopleura dioica]